MPNLPVASWKQIHCGETSWWVDPAWSDQLLDQHGLRLGEWKKAGHVEVIKKSSHRTILRVCLAESSVVVKHYPIHDFLTRLRSRFITKAEREYQRTVQLQEQAVATIRPVAFGQHPQDGSYFISEEITNAQSLEQLLLNHHFHDQHWDPSLKQVFKELAHFLAEMLQHGIIHKDLHAGNILIRTDDQGEREWYLIDPYCVQTSPPSDRAALIYMLSLMGQSLWPLIPERYRLAGWILFRRVSGFHFEKNEERTFLRQLQNTIAQRLYANWHQRARRCTKANREFYELRVRRSRAWASQRLPANWLACFLNNPNSVVNSSESLKKSRHGQVLKTIVGNQAVVISQFFPRHWFDSWLGQWRTSPALHCYRMAYRLETAGIPTASPLAVVEQHEHGKRITSFFLHVFIPDAMRLDYYWPKSTRSDQQFIIRQLAACLKRMHEYRLSHRDLKATNILIQGTNKKLFLIDCRGVSHAHRLRLSRKRKDLARLAITAHFSLHASRTDMLRFLFHYLSVARQYRWKQDWRAIAKLIQKKLRQNKVRNRDIV